MGSELLHPQKHKNMTEANGDSSFLFGWCAIKTETAQDYSTALKSLLDVLNSYWLQTLMELRPFKNFRSNEPWDLWDLWQPLLYWCRMKNVTFLFVQLFRIFIYFQKVFLSWWSDGSTNCFQKWCNFFLQLFLYINLNIFLLSNDDVHSFKSMLLSSIHRYIPFLKITS